MRHCHADIRLAALVPVPGMLAGKKALACSWPAVRPDSAGAVPKMPHAVRLEASRGTVGLLLASERLRTDKGCGQGIQDKKSPVCARCLLCHGLAYEEKRGQILRNYQACKEGVGLLICLKCVSQAQAELSDIGRCLRDCLLSVCPPPRPRFSQAPPSMADVFSAIHSLEASVHILENNQRNILRSKRLSSALTACHVRCGAGACKG